MTQIICRATHCLFWEQGICGSEEIEYEPDTGCLTFQDMGDLELEDDEEEDLDWDSDDDDDWDSGSSWSDDDDDDDDDWEDEL